MNIFHSSPLRALAAALISAGLTGPALADKAITPDMLKDMPLPQVKAYVAKKIQEQAQRRARAGLTDADVTPPVLTKFSMNPTAAAGAYMTGTMSVSDDMSGFVNLYAYGYGTNGMFVGVSKNADYPSKKASGPIIGMVSPYAQTGDYVIVYAYAHDLAGNYVSYDAAALAALGNTKVTVTNNFGVDAVAPRLVSGKILTPTVSLSAFQPGTNIAVYAGVEVRTKDAGDTIVSGLRYVYGNFCLLDTSTCFQLYNLPQRGRQHAGDLPDGRPACPPWARAG